MALLPARNIFDGTSIPTTGTMKTAMGSLRDYLVGLLGTDSTNPSAARSALGAAATGANNDITSLASITSVNGGQLAGFRNVLINGGCQVAQRGSVTFSAPNNLYGGCDRWLASIAGTTVSATMSQSTLSGTSSGYAVQIGSVTTTGTTTVQLVQRIEALNSIALNGKTVTLSGKVYQSSGASRTLTVALNKATALDTFSGGGTLLASTPITVTNSTLTPFSFTLTLGPNDATNGLAAVFQYTGLGAQSSSQFWFADMQLEIGTVATPLEQRSYGLELTLCQRYYEIVYLTTMSTFAYLIHRYKVTKRATPTFTLLTGTPGTATFDQIVDPTGGLRQFTASASPTDLSYAISAEL